MARLIPILLALVLVAGCSHPDRPPKSLAEAKAVAAKARDAAKSAR